MSEESNTQEESQQSTGETEESGETRTSEQEPREDDAQRTQPTEEVTDVTLDVPTLNIEEARLQVDNLRAKVSLQAELADMVKINVGVDAFLEKVELDLKGLEAQATLKANLDNVREILVRTLDSMDNNPDLIDSLAQLAGDSGNMQEGGAGDLGEEESQPQEDESPGDESVGEIEATDVARSKAGDLGVDLSQIEGTGSGGRIIARDVQQAARRA